MVSEDKTKTVDQDSGGLPFVKLEGRAYSTGWPVAEIPIEQIACGLPADSNSFTAAGGSSTDQQLRQSGNSKQIAPHSITDNKKDGFEREVVENTRQQLELDFVKLVGKLFTHPLRVNTRFQIRQPQLVSRLKEQQQQLLRFEQHGYRLSAAVFQAMLRWMLANEENSEAVELGKRAVSLYATDHGVLYLYGLALFRTGNTAEAQKISDKAAAAGAGGDAAFLSGVCNYRQGRLPEAAAMLEKAFTPLQYHEPYLQFAVTVFHEQGSGSWETRVMRSLIELHPDKMEYVARYAALLYRLDRYRQAVSWLEKLLIYHPSNRELLYRIGICYANLGMEQAAAVKLRLVLQDDAHRDADLTMLLLRLQEQGRGDDKIIPLIARIFLREERYDQCEAFCEEFSNGNLVDSVAVVLGLCYIRQQKYRETVQLVGRACISRRHLQPDWNHVQGMARCRLGETAEAKRLLIAGGCEGELAAEALPLLGEIYYNEEQYQEAAETLQQVVRLGNDSLPVLYRLAWSLLKAGFENAAADIFKEIINRDGAAVDAFHNLGTIYARQRLYDKAIPLFKRVLQLQPENREASHNLGLLYRQVLDQSSTDLLERAAEDEIVAAKVKQGQPGGQEEMDSENNKGGE